MRIKRDNICERARYSAWRGLGPFLSNAVSLWDLFDVQKQSRARKMEHADGPALGPMAIWLWREEGPHSSMSGEWEGVYLLISCCRGQ